MKIKTSELTGMSLDWNVAKALGVEPRGGDLRARMQCLRYSKDWELGGPLIDQFSPRIQSGESRGKQLWVAEILIHHEPMGLTYGLSRGETALIALCRALVTAKNDRIRRPYDHTAFLNQQIICVEVDVPDELLIESGTRGWTQSWCRA